MRRSQLSDGLFCARKQQKESELVELERAIHGDETGLFGRGEPLVEMAVSDG